MRRLLLALTVCALPAMALAQGPPPAGPPPGGNWWEKSALLSPETPKTQVHLDGTVSFMDAHGNTDGTSFDTSGYLVLRKHRVSNRLNVQYSNRAMSYGVGGIVDYDELTFRNQVEYDATKTLLMVGGIEEYRNSAVFIASRFTAYGGVGATLRQTAKERVSVIAGLGHAQFTFDHDAILQLNPTAGAQVVTFSPSSGGMLGVENWQYTFPNRMVVYEGMSYMKYFDGELGHLWTFSVSLNAPLTKHVFFSPAYRIKDERNAVVKVLGIKPQDRTLTLGVMVSLQ